VAVTTPWFMSTSRATIPAGPSGRHHRSDRPRKPLRRLVFAVGVLVCTTAAVAAVPVIARHLLPQRRADSVASAPDHVASLPSVPPPLPSARRSGAGIEPSSIDLSGPLAVSFDQLQDSLGSSIGVAWANVGDPTVIYTRGSWSTGPAWSTIKVPLSMAWMHQENARSADATVRSAITVSDNVAAQVMWDALGAHQIAADKVARILAEAGDMTTRVQPEVIRSGYTAFGQTQWSLLRQVQFIAHAACEPRVTPVLDLMGEITAGQRWGLGTLTGAQFKGGWGPGTDGGYLVRQYGVLPTAGGLVAVAIAAQSNGFGGGTAALNRMASWLGSHLRELPAGRCADR
jgi:hypothetical protein